jgi:exosortase
MTHSAARFRSLLPIVVLLSPVLGLAWAFAYTLDDLYRTWGNNPQYSHGYLVPVFAAFLLWTRRERLDRAKLNPSWLGLLVLAGGLAMRLCGGYYGYIWLEQFSLIPCIAGLTVTLGGRAAWRWAWPAVLFLCFMVPLPYRIATAMPGPLQRLATVCSTFVMQTCGLPALAEGNVILLNDVEIGVVEACSGLRMLVVFFALATAVAMVARRPLLDRIVVLVSAIPIALVANIARITATGVLHEFTNSATANAFFHDVAGWFMMPLALVILAIELKVMAALLPVVAVEQFRPVRQPVARRQAVARPRPVPPARNRETVKREAVKREHELPPVTADQAGGS